MLNLLKVAGSQSSMSSVSAVGSSDCREFRRLLGGSGGPNSSTPTLTHRVSAVPHKSLTTEPSSNRRRPSHQHSTFAFYSVAALLVVFIALSRRTERGGGKVSSRLHNADACYLQPLQVPGFQLVMPAALQSATAVAEPVAQRPSSLKVIILWARTKI